MYKILKKDKEYRELELPFSDTEEEKLIKEMRSGRQSRQIILWKGVIVEGYDYYDLCEKYHFSPKIEEYYFSHRDNVISWKCKKQLKRDDLHPNAFAWYLFRLYGAERVKEARQRKKEDFQLKQFSPNTPTPIPLRGPDSERVMKKICEEYKICRGTLSRYIAFGRRLDKLEDMFPGVRERILLGQLCVVRSQMEDLLNTPRRELLKMIEDPECKKLLPKHREIKETRKKEKKNVGVKVETGIKNMPAYDPDAEINSLTYTIGAWTSQVTKVKERTNFQVVTNDGRERLMSAISNLVSEMVRLSRMLEVK